MFTISFFLFHFAQQEKKTENTHDTRMEEEEEGIEEEKRRGRQGDVRGSKGKVRERKGKLRTKHHLTQPMFTTFICLFDGGSWDSQRSKAEPSRENMSW